MKSKKKNILIWGGGLRSLKILNFLNNSFFIKKKNLEVKYIFDNFLKKLSYKKNKIIFSNNVSGFNRIIKDSHYFVVAVGSEYGKARFLISKNLEAKNLKPLDIVNKFSIIDKTSIVGKGLQIEPGAIIQGNCKVGNYCIINTNATVDHGTVIGNGCHVMTGAAIAGRVTIGDFVTIGTNSTILPDIKIAEGAYIGAGSVVVKNVKKNEVVAGNPARKIRLNKHKYDISFFKKI